MSEEYTQEQLNDSQKTLNTLVVTALAVHDKEISWMWKITILNLLFCIFLFVFSSFSKASEFSDAEREFGIPKHLLKALCSVESGLSVGSYNSNDGGSPSYGRCQIKEIAAKQVGWTGDDLLELIYGEAEIYYAARYLQYQYFRYNKNWVMAIAAYNSGRVRLDAAGQFINHNYIWRVLNKCQRLGCQMKLLSLGPVIYPPKKL